MKPWEVTLNCSRSEQSRFPSDRLLTTFDIESHQCYVSFSEHFLVSFGAASRMWSVYSGERERGDWTSISSTLYSRKSLLLPLI